LKKERSMYDLSGKVAMVTGAGRGIGAAIALRLAQEGADVVAVDIDEALVQKVARQVCDLGVRALGYKADVSSENEISSTVTAAMQHFGRIDILVNNAGINLVKPMLEMTAEEWDRLFAVNVKSYWLCTRAVAPQMISRGEGGKIINASSKAGKTPSRYAPMGAYSTTKHGVIGFTRSLALELAPSRINVNCFCPGLVGTDMWDQIDRAAAELSGGPVGALRARAIADIPLGHMDTPAGVARLVAFLASRESDYMTGQSVNLSGGLEMH
jgi:meso-butanediol dehydrogenase/(S,S)-butanediol dehydrogenase/diacetyl reductase